MASFVAFAIIASSAATVKASDNAKPGDLLFPIDVAVEKIQIVISSGKKKDELKIKFAEERLKEVKIVLAEGPADHAATSVFSSATATSPGNIHKSEVALSVALDRLKQTKTDLEEKNNIAAVQALDKVIDRLNTLAENHVSYLDEVEVKIKGNDNKIKIEIEASSNGLKNKFKFEKNDKKNKDDDDEDNEDNEEDEDNEGEEDESELLSDKKITICHKGKTIEIAIPALEAHLDHKDVRGKCADVDVVAPVISHVSSTVSTSTIRITWNTDERADSAVFYATSTPLVISNSTKISSPSLVRNHSIFLSSLNASTTYYFVVSSTDAAGNTATSTQASFITHGEDIVSPVISSVVSSVSTSTVAITWNTNENADSKVFYATSTPVIISSAPVVSSHAMVLSHSMLLPGLNASTTYYFVVSSTDAAGNTATSTQASFITL